MVGLIRGVAIGLLSLSFLGTALYIVAGRGDGKMKDYDLGNDNVNEYYSVYRSIESYGTYGIFKVLNSISSTDDVPYYLFAADLVFSGELDDEDLGVSGNIVFREELSAYTDFARDTFAFRIEFAWHRPVSHASFIRFEHAENSVNRARPDSGASRSAGRTRRAA